MRHQSALAEIIDAVEVVSVDDSLEADLSRFGVAGQGEELTAPLLLLRDRHLERPITELLVQSRRRKICLFKSLFRGRQKRRFDVHRVLPCLRASDGSLVAYYYGAFLHCSQMASRPSSDDRRARPWPPCPSVIVYEICDGGLSVEAARVRFVEP